MREQNVRVRHFIIESVESHPADIVTLTCQMFGLKRQSVTAHVNDLCKEGILIATGNTRARRYELQVLDSFEGTVELAGLEEDRVWSRDIGARLKDVSKNARDILGYGFTEMLNNAIDHSESPTAEIRFRRTAKSVRLEIQDRGVGIFRKIRNKFDLPDERAAILELAKGKLTTDPRRHSGEGIFFTSRMMDSFTILSGSLFFTHLSPQSDWLIEADQTEVAGTIVRMSVSAHSKTEIKELFDRFSANPEELTFSKTHVPIKLAQYGEDNLVSRSQARRVLMRFERFAEVLLDFAGVDFIGQAFADEIFRVFKLTHPEVTLIAINTTQSVAGMIHRAKVAAEEQGDSASGRKS